MRLKKRKRPLSAISYKAGQAVDVLRGPVSGRPARIVATYDGLAVLVIEEADIVARNFREWDATVLAGSLDELDAATHQNRKGILFTDFDNIRPAKTKEGR